MMQHLTLSELTSLVNDALEKNLKSSYWLVAEVGELKVNSKGHCYLELRENAENELVAKVRATIWSYTYRNLSAWFEKMTDQPLSEGMNILANVQVKFHKIYGFSLNIRDIDPSYTIGDKARIRKITIDKLHEDGIFDMNKQLILPEVPQRIALISSSMAAGYGDFINQSLNNIHGYQLKITLFEAIMQGKEAPHTIITALQNIHKSASFDVVVIIRGGGAQSDLDCFDDYDLASHVAQFPIPVITGIGHERDETITDLVAHTKMKTPTAVADFVIQGMTRFEESIIELFNSIAKIASFRIQNETNILTTLKNNVFNRFRTIVTNHQQLLLSRQHTYSILLNQVSRHNHDMIQNLEERISLLNPQRILNRGYTLTYFNGKPIGKLPVKIGSMIKTISSNCVIESVVSKQLKNG